MQDVFALARAELDRLPGVAGVRVRELGGSELFAYGDDDVFPAASVIKVPLVMTLFAQAAEGLVTLDERLPIGDKHVGAVPVFGTGILRDLVDVADMSLRDLATLTITLSDNVATNRLIDRLGFEPVARRLSEWGCPRTRLVRRMFDEDAKSRGLE